MIDPLKQIISDIEQAVTTKYENTEYCDSYCAFIDILGMKDLIAEDYATIRKVFNVIEQGVLLYAQIKLPNGEQFISTGQMKVTIMSDSIVLSIPAGIEQALPKLIGFTSYLIQNFLTALNTPIYVRGGIARGNIYQDGNIVFGPALVDAYQLESNIAISMRCVLSTDLHTDQSLVEYLDTDTHGLSQDPRDNMYFIAYAKADNFQLLTSSVNNILAATNNDRIRFKYEWLREYIERVENA